MEINILIPRLISLFLILLQIFSLRWINWHIYLCLWPIRLYYYYACSDMSGFMQTSYFFGYMACICYGFFLMLGTVGFRAALLFVRHIYRSNKCEQLVDPHQGSSPMFFLLLYRWCREVKWYFCSISCSKSRSRVPQISCFMCSMLQICFDSSGKKFVYHYSNQDFAIHPFNIFYLRLC